MPIFTFPVISFASAGAVGFGQNRPVTGSIRNCPSRMRKIAATSAIRRIRRHDAGRFNPIADHLPSRSRIEMQSEHRKNDHFVRHDVENVMPNHNESAEAEFERAQRS